MVVVPSAQQREPCDLISVKIAGVDETYRPATEFYARIGAVTKILTRVVGKDRERGAQLLAPKEAEEEKKRGKELKTVIMNSRSEKFEKKGK